MAKQNSFDDDNTRAPSATAAAFKQNADPAGTRIRTTNTMPNIFEQPNPYPVSPGANAPQAPDRSGPNISYIGGNPNDPVAKSQSNTAALFAKARSTNDLADRSALLREALGSQQFDRAQLDSTTALSQTDSRNQSATDIANLRARSDAGINEARNAVDLQLGNQRSEDDRFGIETRAAVSRDTNAATNATSRANTSDNLLARALSDNADNSLRRRELDQKDVGSYSLADHFTLQGQGGFTAGTQQERQSLEAAFAGARTDAERTVINNMLRALDGQPAPGGYQGGMVHPGGFAPGYAEGGIVEPGQPNAPLAIPQQQGPDPALINKYTQYSEGARAMGLTAIGFEQFAQMAQGAAATGGQQPAPSGAGAPVAMAAGGEVPSASEGGRMVIDSDPNAPTDSIPAVIDGNQPAKLDSGELVFPRHAVLYYGTDKLNKMIAKSKEAEGGNGESATGLNG